MSWTDLSLIGMYIFRLLVYERRAKGTKVFSKRIKKSQIWKQIAFVENKHTVISKYDQKTKTHTEKITKVLQQDSNGKFILSRKIQNLQANSEVDLVHEFLQEK